MRKKMFVAGRLIGRSTVVVFITPALSPIVGPWAVRAVVSAN